MILFEDDFTSPERLSDQWTSTFPGDDSPAGVATVSLLTPVKPASGSGAVPLTQQAPPAQVVAQAVPAQAPAAAPKAMAATSSTLRASKLGIKCFLRLLMVDISKGFQS